MIAKKRSQNGKIFLSICDKEIIGNVFVEEDKVLDLKSSFYQGEEINKEDLKEIIKKSYFITCVGKKSIKYLKNFNIISKDNIREIQNIPYSFVLIE